MKKIEQGSIKFYIIQSISIMVAGFIIFPLGDYLFSKIFKEETFKYTVIDHIITPIIVGVLAGLFYYLFDKRKKKVTK